MMGPNTATGHLSVIYTTECQVNFSLRLLKPILQGPLFSLVSRASSADTVCVTPAAERRDNDWIRKECARLVWSTGCTSWYIDAHTGRNTMLYPYWQFNYWWRSIFIPYSRDFVFETSRQKIAPAPSTSRRSRRRRLSNATTAVAAVTSGLGVVLAVRMLLGVVKSSDVENSVVGYLEGLSRWTVRSSEHVVNSLRSTVFGSIGWKI
jgi:hypothetical protein